MMGDMIFSPSAELLQFAKDFSENYKILSEGRYTSSLNNYCIDYIFVLKCKNGNDAKTFSRVLKSTGKIELDKATLYKNDNVTDNFVFYLIIWCVLRFRHESLSDVQIDRHCVDYYASVNLPTSEVISGYKFGIEPTRCKMLCDYISNKVI